ncbi:conjugal transfer protein TraD (plasmid) [Methylobacterium radiotolerans]|uniref:conjugal transfer protein TraD n=1 Tax=Methylobacterium TaxID=407 RepID=UPI0005E10E75|nr:conjugal transfer protein TraD [Methylobacterium radiotolerans]MBN6819858.1 conjugal transfer protein TraD [Methylobacterium organophilum]OXE43391.1 conjugal transfer protein TraD [Methylobacterium radiotolerans]GAN47330.1 conjugal transfer protein TraD [Methylobacterium sp. ME121]
MNARRDERRTDAHLKIQLGGLIVKAGLAAMPRDQLLGLLLDGKERARDPDTAEHFVRLGENAFRE